MKKGIFIFLLALASQVEAQEYKNDSVSLFTDLLVWTVREGGADN